ncbi:MAG: type IV pilus assembly protein PilM [Planctomycetes bacterium]|nr:type IV pilus assembly protein PilM [Planctomycetota bacterium]
MSKANESWGIEVGQNAIKAIHLVRTETDLVVADYEILPFKKILSTPDLDVHEAIQVNLDQFLSRHNVAKSTVMLSVPGHMAFARFTRLPPVDPKSIPDVVRFEAQQQIPFQMDQIEWDYQVFSQADSPDVGLGIFAITKDRVLSFLDDYRKVGMAVDGITLSPLAVYNAMVFDHELKADSAGMIFVDIGTVSTDLIIVEPGQVWLRTLQIGGNNFTDALVRAFKLSFPKAEKLKRDASTSKYARQIFQAMRPVFSDLVQEVQRSLGYYQSLNRDSNLTRMVGLGSTFRLPGMVKFLKQQLQMDVIRPDGFKRVRVEGKREAEMAENAMNLMTAYGLALQGLDLAAVHSNLLPRHIIKQRLWNAKQPWIATAAAVMVASAAMAGVRLWKEQSAYQSDFAIAESTVAKVIRDATDLRNKWKEIEGGRDPRQQIENLRRILDYREVWPRFMVDLDMAAQALAPQPPLLTSDYKLIAAVPRDERRRLYIESTKVVYQYGDGRTAANRPAESVSIEELFGGRRHGSVDAEGPTESATASKRLPPSFEVTLVGYTPYKDAVKLLGDSYIKWLQDNARRRGRPYDIVASRESLVSVERVQESEHGTGEGGGGNREAISYPTRPPEAETAVGPGWWKFVLRWRLSLIRPEDARIAEEDPLPPAPTPPAGQTTPAVEPAPPAATPPTHTTPAPGATPRAQTQLPAAEVRL